MKTATTALFVACVVVAIVAGAVRPALAQDVCSVGPLPDCAVTPVLGDQPCTLDVRRSLDFAANQALGAEAPVLPLIQRGCGAGVPVPGRAPCQLLRAFAWARSGWRQFCAEGCGDDAEGRTHLGSFCGIGLTQVDRDDLPDDVDPARVASSIQYNAGAGARRLADAWGKTPCVGSANPDVAEHWYFAVWAADAFTYLNNPNNPAYPVQRGIYGDPSGFDRDSYPFQEVVFGLAGHPPTDDRGFPMWTPSPVNLPSTLDVCGTGGCVPGNIASPQEVHDRDCPPFVPPGQDAGVEPPDAAVGQDSGPDAGSDAGNIVPDSRVAGCTCRAPGANGPDGRPGAFLAVALASIGLLARAKS